MEAGNLRDGARLRVVFEPDISIGPGKADIPEAIRDTGSIAATGSRVAWLLQPTATLLHRRGRSSPSANARTRCRA